jgi:hypothetical protein
MTMSPGNLNAASTPSVAPSQVPQASTSVTMGGYTGGSFLTNNRLAMVIREDPRKAVVLVVLVLVMVGLWVKVLMGSNGAPRRAGASVTQITPAAAQKTVAKDNARVSMKDWMRDPVKGLDLERNLFAVKLDYFPQDGTKVSQAILASPVGDGFWDQLAKSMTFQADLKKEREILRENIRLQAAQLQLQSIMMGASPKALMNGGLVGEGDVVAEFRIRKIEARRVIVEREGIRLAIEMK